MELTALSSRNGRAIATF